MSAQRQFIDLTEVFSQRTQVSEDPHTWWNRLKWSLDPYYNYNPMYETTPASRQVVVPVDDIVKIVERPGDDGYGKAAVVMERGGSFETLEDKDTIRQKIAAARPRASQ